MERKGYDDILNTTYPFPLRHERMEREKRAAQFAAFRALAGFEGEIGEAARLTQQRIELGEDARAALDARLRLLRDRAGTAPEVTVTYFLPDGRKEGGKYARAPIRLRRVDEGAVELVAQDGVRIPIGDILWLEGGLFDGPAPQRGNQRSE